MVTRARIVTSVLRRIDDEVRLKPDTPRVARVPALSVVTRQGLTATLTSDVVQQQPKPPPPSPE